MLHAIGYSMPISTAAPVLTDFVSFVAQKHSHQRRRNGAPYFNHCAQVARIARAIANEYAIDDIHRAVIEAAGYGHDLFEDTTTDYDDVVKQLGEDSGHEVAALISWVSDDKRLPGILRHQAFMVQLHAAPLRAQIVKLADTYDNVLDSFELLSARPIRTSERGSPIDFLRRWCQRATSTISNLTKLDTRTSYYESTVRKLTELRETIAAIDGQPGVSAGGKS